MNHKGIICPHGISYTTKLGEEEPEFNPEDWGLERFNKTETIYTYTEEEINEGEKPEQREL